MKIANSATRLSFVVLVSIAILGGLDRVDRSGWEPPPVTGIVAVPPVPIDPPRPTLKPCDRLPDPEAGAAGWPPREGRGGGWLTDELRRALKQQADIGAWDG